MIVQNMDIAGLVRRIRRHKIEIHKSNSAGLMFTTEKDVERIISYLDSLDSYFDWMVSQPMQDFVKWHPTDIDLGQGEPLVLVENEALADLIQMMDALEQEVGNSQSAGMHSSIMEPDETRFREITAKMRSFVEEYIASNQPLDMPESVPSRQLSGKGKLSRK